MTTMTTQDQNKKTLRHFQCRDYLWEIFEQMGAELECSTDYLVNEAMRQYARSRNWGNRGSRPGAAPLASGGSSAGHKAAAAAPLPAPVMSAQPPRPVSAASMAPAVTSPPPYG